MSIIQLDPPLPLMTPKGASLCHFLIDYSIDHHLYWVCFINETGECWTFANPEIRAESNISYGRILNKTNPK